MSKQLSMLDLLEIAHKSIAKDKVKNAMVIYFDYVYYQEDKLRIIPVNDGYRLHEDIPLEFHFGLVHKDGKVTYETVYKTMKILFPSFESEDEVVSPLDEWCEMLPKTVQKMGAGVVVDIDNTEVLKCSVEELNPNGHYYMASVQLVDALVRHLNRNVERYGGDRQMYEKNLLLYLDTQATAEELRRAKKILPRIVRNHKSLVQSGLSLVGTSPKGFPLYRLKVNNDRYLYMGVTFCADLSKNTLRVRYALGRSGTLDDAIKIADGIGHWGLGLFVSQLDGRKGL